MDKPYNFSSGVKKGTVLITGGAGFIGSHTTIEIMKAGYEPIILDDFSNSKPGD